MQSLLTNAIICGDCAEKMKQYIPSESIDLIYMDPPFFSGRNYEIIWNDGTEVRSFEDKEFYKRVCGNCEKKMPHEYIQCPYCGASKNDAKEVRMNDIESYIEWLKVRLLECHRVLKSTGSIYVHLDWHAVHYVKIVMDDIFGYSNFINEIVWQYPQSIKRSTKKFLQDHDTILYYSKTTDYVFNQQTKPYTNNQLKRFKHIDDNGKYYCDTRRDKNNNKKRVKVYLTKEGTPIDSVWYFNRVQGNEKLGYPTQKPEALLERIINTSSNPGNLILDPFCGCGTSISVSQKIGRRWIGIDVSPTSCDIMIDRVRKIGYDIDASEIIDMPTSTEQLKNVSPFEFQNRVACWLGGRQTTKKSGDRGIDGYTFDGTPIQAKQRDKIGSPELRLFAQDIRDINKTKGIIVAFGFTSTANKEAKHINDAHGITIKLVTVDDILNGWTND